MILECGKHRLIEIAVAVNKLFADIIEFVKIHLFRFNGCGIDLVREKHDACDQCCGKCCSYTDDSTFHTDFFHK